MTARPALYLVPPEAPVDTEALVAELAHAREFLKSAAAPLPQER